MSSSAKLTGTTPVSTSATSTLVKLSGTKLVTTSSSPVQATTVSTDVGTMTEHHLPNSPEETINYFPFEEENEEKKVVQSDLNDKPVIIFDDVLSMEESFPMTLHETMRHIGTYETNMETTQTVVKKSTKAFG